MNRRERRYGRMYLLPLLLALTGLALLPLEWVLRLSSFDAFGDLGQTVLHSSMILFYPLVLMLLFAVRVSPKTARVFCFVSLFLSLVQLIVALYCNRAAPYGLLLWVPGHMLMPHIHAAQQARTAQNILLVLSDASFLLSSLSAVITCLIYAKVKTHSDLRNAEFDRKNAYLCKDDSQIPAEKSKKEPAKSEPPAKPAIDAATRVVPIPKEDD